jgi:hypothetical protein
MVDPDKKRQDLEKLALVRFKEVAYRYSPIVYDKQGDANRVAQLGRSYFQFGDLRVDTSQRHIIVEVESAGGVTNLVKYWYCLEERYITKPIHLLHIFAQASENDYIRHLYLWDSLAAKMSNDLSNMFTAKRYTYRSSTELEVVVGEFEGILKKEFGR